MYNQPFLIEVCANSLQSAINAEKGGAHRVELCDNLYEGGTTPSAATLQLAQQRLHIDIFAMIRPRGGDFCYTDLEFEIMQADIVFCKSLGIAGVVFGILKPDGTIDLARTKALVALAAPMKVTFHRAIDMAAQPLTALEVVIASGCHTILTSGQHNKAIQGIYQIQKMVEQANNRIEIMAGSGVNAQNVLTFARIGVRCFHLSGQVFQESPMVYRNPTIAMGGLSGIPEYGVKVTATAKIKALREVLEGYFKIA